MMDVSNWDKNFQFPTSITPHPGRHLYQTHRCNQDGAFRAQFCPKLKIKRPKNQKSLTVQINPIQYFIYVSTLE